MATHSLNPNLDHAREFLACLGSKDNSDRFTFQTYAEGEAKEADGSWALNRILNGTFDEHKDELIELNRRGAGVFVNIARTDLQGRTHENVVSLRAAFVDSDTGQISLRGPRPNILVNSARGQHAYWLLNPSQETDRFDDVQVSLARRFGTDEKVKSITRVMRLPGFYHQKGDPAIITLEHAVDECPDASDKYAYTYDELIDFLGLVIEARTTKYNNTHDSVTVSDYPLEERQKRAQAYIDVLGPAIYKSGDGHSKTVSACQIGHDFGLHPEEYWPILLAWGHRCDPAWDELKLRKEYDSVIKSQRYPFGAKLIQGNNSTRPRLAEINRRTDEWVSSDPSGKSSSSVSLYTGDDPPPEEPPDFDLPPVSDEMNRDVDVRFTPVRDNPGSGGPSSPPPRKPPRDHSSQVKSVFTKHETNIQKNNTWTGDGSPGYLTWAFADDPPELEKLSEGKLKGHFRGRASDHHANAWKFLVHAFRGQEKTLHFQNGLFYYWNNECYRTIPRDNILVKSKITSFLGSCADTDGMDDDGNPKWKKITFSPIHVNHVIENCKQFLSLDPIQYKSPCWLDNAQDRPDAREVVCCSNGILDIRNRELLDRTPLLFSKNSINFEYDPKSQNPVEWHGFLDDIFSDDTEARELLQMWFGYCLTEDTRHHKLLMMVGPPRSGKGTILRVLKAMIGAHAYGSMNFEAMENNFGLSSATDKSVVIFPDARIGLKSNQSKIVSDLLSITGEDTIRIDRKNLDPVDVELKCRVIIVSNEVLKLYDPSGAMANRTLMIRFLESFAGREDRSLTEKLLEEMPGIFNWAIDGWHLLQERGEFRQPKSSQEHLDLFASQSSPINEFVDECCIVDPEEEVPVNNLFFAWQKWAKDNGYHTGAKNTFGRQLLSVLPRLTKSRIRAKSGARNHLYLGLGLRDAQMGLKFTLIKGDSDDSD